MKIIPLALIFQLSMAPAWAAGGEAPPKNPFQNLPSQPDPTAFNPFDDEMDDSRFVPPASTYDNGSAPVTPIGSSGGPSRNGVRPTSAGGKKADPAQNKDIVENFDYPDADILDVTKAISRLTGKNFIYNPQDFKGKVSIVSESAITVADAWNAYLTALNMKGFALVPSGKYLRIERTATAKEKQTPVMQGKEVPISDEYITRVIPLRYIDAYEVENVFRQWVPRESRMQAFQQTNTIIITSTSSHISHLMQLIALLDVAGYQESLVVVPIRNAAAKDIAKLIEQIISEGTSSSSRFGNSARPSTAYSPSPRPVSPTGGSSRGANGRAGGVSISKIIADDRTNSLIVKANAAGINEIKVLVNRLDTKVASSMEGAGRIHVVRLQFADAEQLAKTLSAITGSGSSRSSTTNRPSFFSPYGAESSGTVFQGDIKVSADKSTQSLVVTASPQDYVTMKRVIESLDVPRDQVFVEAIIMEMKLNRDNAYGTSFVSAPNGTANPSASGNLTKILTGDPLSIGGFALGFKSGIERPGIKAGDKEFKFNSINGLLEFIQSNTDTNVIATPKVIALDNEEASMEISEMIPLESIQTTGSTTTSSISSDKAQLLLKVTPQINKASDFVKLKIDQKLENFDSGNVPKSLQDKAKGKNTRSTTTSVIVQNEDTVVLSGLMRDSVDEIVSKVPILGDIPILGWLFKSSKTEARKTNLLVFITPRIIKQYEMVRKVLDLNLQERDEFIRDNIGSRDPILKGIQKLRRSLPSLDKINPYPTGNSAPQNTTINAPASPDRESQQPYNDYYDPYPSDFGAPPISPIDIPPVGSNAMGDYPPPPPPPPPGDFE